MAGSFKRMEPGIIDWDSIDSVFIEDDTYENMNAPKWVDFSAFPEQPVNDEAWFCKPGTTLLNSLSLVSKKVIKYC